MANTCFTKYVLEGPQADLEAIRAAALTGRGTKGPFRTWAGGMLEALGITGTEGVDLREEYSDVSLRDGVLTIDAEGKWDPKLDAWRAVKAKYPEVKVFFLAEEFGCDIFFSNDLKGRHFQCTYALDWGDGDDGEVTCFETDEEVVSWVNGKFGTSFRSADEIDGGLDEALGELCDDSYANLHILALSEEDADLAS